MHGPLFDIETSTRTTVGAYTTSFAGDRVGPAHVPMLTLTGQDTPDQLQRFYGGSHCSHLRSISDFTRDARDVQ